jgi:hypothetical protein
MESQQVLVNVPGARPAAVSERTEKFSLFALTSMVVGSMVGAGIFSLPRAFATATGPFGAIIAWAIAAAGRHKVCDHHQWLDPVAIYQVPGGRRAMPTDRLLGQRRPRGA